MIYDKALPDSIVRTNNAETIHFNFPAITAADEFLCHFTNPNRFNSFCLRLQRLDSTLPDVLSGKMIGDEGEGSASFTIRPTGTVYFWSENFFQLILGPAITNVGSDGNHHTYNLSRPPAWLRFRFYDLVFVGATPANMQVTGSFFNA